MPFDPVKDITPIAIMGTTPIVLVVNPQGVEAKNSKEMVALLKSRPGQVNYGSSGNGTILHLAAQQFLDAAVVKATHVPYKGVGPMVTDLLGGGSSSAPSPCRRSRDTLKSGALARDRRGDEGTGRGHARCRILERGLQYVSEAWFAVVGPKGLPRPRSSGSMPPS